MLEEDKRIELPKKRKISEENGVGTSGSFYNLSSLTADNA